jgi:uncharacterized protein YaaW (UPF0174 family)
MVVHRRSKTFDKGRMDAKKILSKVEQQTKKKTYAFSIEVSIMEALKKKVGKAKLSRIVEELLKEFLDSLDKKSGDSK